MSVLLVCRPVACPIIPPYIIPPLTDELLPKLRALPIASPKAVVGIAAFLLPALGLRQRLPFVHFCDLSDVSFLLLQAKFPTYATHLLRSGSIVRRFVVPYADEPGKAE